MKWKLRYIYSEPLDTETLLYKRDCCARVGGGGSPSSFEVLVYVDLFSLFLSFLSDTRIHRMIRQLCSKESCGVIDNGNTTTAPILAYLLLYLRGRCVWERRRAREDGVLKECAVPTNLFQMLISLLLSFFLSPCLYSFFLSFSLPVYILSFFLSVRRRRICIEDGIRSDTSKQSPSVADVCGLDRSSS